MVRGGFRATETLTVCEALSIYCMALYTTYSIRGFYLKRINIQN